MGRASRSSRLEPEHVGWGGGDEGVCGWFLAAFGHATMGRDTLTPQSIASAPIPAEGSWNPASPASWSFYLPSLTFPPIGQGLDPPALDTALALSVPRSKFQPL